MKTILALCLFLAVASLQATFVPEWVSCDKHDPKAHWVTLNVSLDAPPAAGKNSTFTYCGDSLTYGFMPTNITVTSGTLLDLAFPESGSIWFRVAHCFNVTFQIPQGPKDLEISLVLNGVTLPGAGCANITLHLDNHHKFLHHSF